MTNLRASNTTIASPLTAFGDLRIAELSPIFQYSYEYTVDNTELSNNTPVNGGTITQSQAMGIVGTSTTTASTALLVSKKMAKYKSGLGGLLRFTALFESGGVAGTAQLAGLADERGSSEAFKNGYMIGYIGTVFGFHRFQNDTITTVALADWDDPLDGSGASRDTIDNTKINVWAITFQYLGAGAIRLFRESKKSGFFDLVHTIQYADLNITPSVFMPNFHGTFFVNNAGTTSDLVLKFGSQAYFVEGKASPILVHQPHQSTGILSKSSVTTEVAIFTIRVKSTYASKTNFIEVFLENFTASIEAGSANNLGDLRLVLNTTLGGTPSYSDINTSNSVVELDTAGTTLTGGKTFVPIPLAGKNDSTEKTLIPLKFLLEPGDSITVAAASANTATIKASLLWRELF